MDTSAAKLTVHVDSTETRQALEEFAGTIEARQLLPGKPLFTIATLLTVLASILTAIVTAGLTLAGALPAGLEAEGIAIVKATGLIGAIALAGGQLGKALYGIAVALDNKAVAGAIPPIEISTSNVNPN